MRPTQTFSYYKNPIILGLALALLGGLASAAGAASFTRDETGASAASFLKIPVSPRSVGMGGGYTAVADGPEAIWWNPAGLLAQPNNEMLLESCAYMKDLLFSTFAYRLPLGEGDILGLMINDMRFSIPMEGFDNAGLSIGPVPYDDLAVTVSYATTAFDMPFGVNLKLISSTLSDVKAMAVAGDVGVRQNFFKDNLTAAISIKNFGQPMTWVQDSYPLPFSISAAVAYRLLDRDLTFDGEIQAPFDQVPHFHLGVELARNLGLALRLALRVGYNTDWQGYTDPITGLAAGLGFEYRLLQRVLTRTGRMTGYKEQLVVLIGVDYAFVPNSDLEPTHRLGLKVGF